ncbi:hypothetical protein [Streptomyces sp. SAJ15]|uniref:hypothetical protein n=1 Tax=Streptomyces sp. SAJ15 TaxID=2011095 RepID=UPI0028CB5FCD|nr:hypothetical protein [Streptomyces sp. SAJ15]
MVGGGVLAAGAVAAIVATAIVASGDDKDTAGSSAGPTAPAKELPAESPTPEPTFSNVAPPAPLEPLDIISDKKLDKAPLRATSLFPEKKAASNGRTYTRGATTATTNCASATRGGLGPALTNNGCRQLFRATYEKDGVAVTVGIAVFDTPAAAEKAKSQATPGVISLPGEGVPAFCRGPACRSSANAIGRYAYFTTTGYTNGKPVTTKDPRPLEAGRDLSDYAFRRILARGESQARAAASAGA